MRKLLLLIIIFNLQFSCFAQQSKMSPFVRQVYLEQEARQRSELMSRSSVPEDRMMPVFVKTSDREALRSEGYRILAEFGDVYIISTPVSRLGELSATSGVERIEASEHCEATNDGAASITHAADLHTATPTGYTGKDVVMGLMDIGFDLTHPTFWSADGTEYRIRRFWDQLDQTSGGSPVTGVDEKGNDTTYVGRQYISQEEILAKGCSADGHKSGHGTHTAGTAAGSGRNEDGSLSDYAGMAPEADICLVSNATSIAAGIIPEEDWYKYNSALDALGFKYIFDYAESVGKPCVISFSEGSTQEMEGKNALFNEAMLAMQGQGRIFVSSAGNEGNKLTYINKPLGTSSAGAFVRPYGKRAYYNTRSSDKMTLRITYYPSDSDPIIKEYHTDQILPCEKSILADTFEIAGVKEVVLLNAYPNVYDNSQWVTEVLLTTTDNTVTIGQATPISVTLLGGDISVEAFSRGGYFTTNSKDASLCNAEATHNVLSYGALESAICVGSVKKTSPYLIAGDSGVGPAVTGITKPDVVAPGVSIMSAKSKAYYGSYGWFTMTGTSMATPVVGGIVALWLEACPTLTREQALEAIANTSSHPDTSLSYPNNTYGHGLIDAEAGLQYILSHFTGVENLSPTLPRREGASYYDLQGRKLSGKPTAKGIYIHNGRKYAK